MKKIFSYYKFYKLRLVIIVIMKFIGTALDLVIPFLLSYILDKVIPTLSKDNFLPIIWYGLIMIGCSVLAFVLSFKANQLSSYVGCHCAERVRNDLFVRIEKLSLRQIDEVSMPSLISRISTDTYNENQFYNILLRLGIRAPVLFFGGIIASFILNVRLTLILLCCIPLIMILIILIGKLCFPLLTKTQKAIDDLVRTLREDITGIRVIKGLSKEKYENERFAKVNKKVIDLELKSGTTMNVLSPSINLIMNVSLSAVVLVGAILYNRMNNQATSGQIIAFLSYFNIILNSTVQMSRVFITYSKASASGERIKYILDLPMDLEKKDSSELSSHFIEFRNVSFSYNGNEMNLKNINFTLEKNQSLGIIGGTGSGKTTILNLLCRFYDSNKGKVFVDYQDVKTFDKLTLNCEFGSVFQNDSLFNMSIRDNIKFYRDISEEQIIRALRTSQSDFVYSLKDQLDSQVEERGNNFSGGQKQRLLIARSLAGQPKVLIFDDCSSALDYKTDANMRQAIRKNYPDTTMIVVSQRISSIMNCDKILVIDKGQIVDFGTNEELLNRSDIYQEIYASQIGGDYHA